MTVIRVEKTKDYTTMANYHLRDTELSLKAKGLQSFVLGLPDDWDLTLAGLATRCEDGVESIKSGMNELEKRDYVKRERTRVNGQFRTIYTFYEKPTASDFTTRENTTRQNTEWDSTTRENMPQLNKQELNNQICITPSINPSNSEPPLPPDEVDYFQTTQRIKENIDYDFLIKEYGKIGEGRIDEVIDVMVEAVLSTKPTLRVNKQDMAQ